MFSEQMSGPQMIVLGLLILVVGFVLRRTALRSKRSSERDIPGEVRSEFQITEKAARSWIHGMEVRLHDYQREVEARIETKKAELDYMIGEADKEITRLTQLVRESSGREIVFPDTQPEEIPVQLDDAEIHQFDQQKQRFMILRLSDAGFTRGEIAGIAHCSVELVDSILDDVENRGRGAA